MPNAATLPSYEQGGHFLGFRSMLLSGEAGHRVEEDRGNRYPPKKFSAVFPRRIAVFAASEQAFVRHRRDVIPVLRS